MTAIKIFGERNTGTNYLWWLLEHNTNAVLLPGSKPRKRGWMKSTLLFDHFYNTAFRHELGWKHGFPVLEDIKAWHDPGNLLLVTLTKNPYAFLLSLFKKPYHYQGEKPPDFSTFLRTPWRTLKRENYSQKSFHNPIEIWNLKNVSYIGLEGKTGIKTLNFQYETLLNNPELTISEICKNHKDLRMNAGFINLETSTKSSTNTYRDYKDYYLQERWRDFIAPEDRYYIQQHLDKEVMKYFGYDW